MNISSLLELSHLEITKDTIQFTEKTRRWCRLPYLNHPNGCLNFDKSPLCPPKAPYLRDKITHYNYFYLILGRFNLSKYKRQMLLKHPNWSDRQARCVLYWQSSVKKHLKKFIRKIYDTKLTTSLFLLSCGSGFKNLDIPQTKIYSMEAAGIDVFNTLKRNKI